MRFAVLGSGSGGNAAVVDCRGVRLLVDAGLSAKQLVLRLGAVGIPPESLDGILLTHEHGDHVRGLRVFLRQFPVPVYGTAGTIHLVRESGVVHHQWRTFDSGRAFAIGHTEIAPFATQHDAVDPVGYVLRHNGRSLGVLSDAGHVTRSIIACLLKLDALFVEANYDEALLDADVKRPWPTKQRISSRHGHLSNTQVVELIGEIAHPQLTHVILGHLSSDCNCPKLVQRLLRECLTRHGLPGAAIHCAGQHEPTGWFEW
jgi:phosphoribosyl 1,2-cyclic phosphodiesterase